VQLGLSSLFLASSLGGERAKQLSACSRVFEACALLLSYFFPEMLSKTHAVKVRRELFLKKLFPF
jgi:hypothetical protein